MTAENPYQHSLRLDPEKYQVIDDITRRTNLAKDKIIVHGLSLLKWVIDRTAEGCEIAAVTQGSPFAEVVTSSIIEAANYDNMQNPSTQTEKASLAVIQAQEVVINYLESLKVHKFPYTDEVAEYIDKMRKKVGEVNFSRDDVFNHAIALLDWLTIKKERGYQIFAIQEHSETALQLIYPDLGLVDNTPLSNQEFNYVLMKRRVTHL